MAKRKIVKIEFGRAEGPTHLCGLHTFDTWKEVEQHINTQAATAPTFGYDKCDFKLFFENDNEYHGRFDLKIEHMEGNNLAEHVLHELQFYGGLLSPDWLSKEDYKNFCNGQEEQYKAFLEEHQIGEEEVVSPV